MKVTDELIYAFVGGPTADREITATDAHTIRVGLQAVLDLIDRQEWPKPHLDPAMIRLRGVSHETTIIDIPRAEYKRAKEEGTLDHELDAYLSDMSGKTYVIEPDGTVVNPYE